jgi:hypothetical protein
MVKLVLRDFSQALNVMQMDKTTVFASGVVFDESARIQFHPNAEQLTRAVVEVMKDIVTLFNTSPRVVHHPGFEKFLTEGDQPMYSNTGPSVQQFLYSLQSFDNIMANVKETIDKSYSAAMTYSKHFQEFAYIYKFGQDWSISKYQAKTPDLETFSTDFAKFRKWATEVDSIQTAATRGILFIDSKNLKASLVPIPTGSIQDLKELLTAIAAEKTANLLELFRTSISALASEPTSLEEYILFFFLIFLDLWNL